MFCVQALSLTFDCAQRGKSFGILLDNACVALVDALLHDLLSLNLMFLRSLGSGVDTHGDVEAIVVDGLLCWCGCCLFESVFVAVRSRIFSVWLFASQVCRCAENKLAEDRAFLL